MNSNRLTLHALLVATAMLSAGAANAQLFGGSKPAPAPAPAPTTQPASANAAALKAAAPAPAPTPAAKPAVAPKPVAMKAAAPASAPTPVVKAKPKYASAESIALVKALSTVYQGAN
jgi:hypothetical protein